MIPADRIPESVEYSASTSAWSEHKFRVIDPIDAETARKRHDAGEGYGAVVPVPGGIAAVKMIDADKVWVNFYGVWPGTRFYAFDRRGERLWLAEFQRRNGKGRHPDACAHFFRWKDPESPADIACFDNETPRGRSLAEREDWDPEANWFDWPAFGDYDALVDPDLIDRVWPDAPPLPERRP